jgi:hypothetical protein
MIARIRAGSLTTDSSSAIRLWPSTSASVAGWVTVQPWEQQVPGFLLDEHGRAMVGVRLGVDCHEL